MITELDTFNTPTRPPKVIDYGGIGTFGIMDTTEMSTYYTNTANGKGIVESKRKKIVKENAPPALLINSNQKQIAKTARSVSFQDTVEAIAFSASTPVFGLGSSWTVWRCSEFTPNRSCVVGPLELERVDISVCGVLQGQAIVRNLAFQKAVIIRISLDHWRSFVDISATYSHSRASNSIDVFEFEFDLTLSRHCESFEIVFAIKCEMNGTELWDNNCGENYSITAHTSSCPSPRVEHLPLNDRIELPNTATIAATTTATAIAATKPAYVSIYSNYFLPSSLTNPHHHFNWSFS